MISKKLNNKLAHQDLFSSKQAVKWLNKMTPFAGSVVSRIKISVLLGATLSFVLLVLEPFNTNEFQSDNRFVLLLGFGIVLSLLYIVHNALENVWYMKFGRSWSRRNELLSALTFILVSGTVIYLYNYLVVNGISYSFRRHLWYYGNIVLPLTPLIIIPFLWFRRKLGEVVVPLAKDAVKIIGEINGEEINIKKKDLIYIKAEQNYVTIYHLDEKSDVNSTLLRLTLSSSHEQAPFLVRCHKSYLVNLSAVTEIRGNSQKARILFTQTSDVVPLSKSYYKDVKEELSSKRLK